MSFTVLYIFVVTSVLFAQTETQQLKQTAADTTFKTWALTPPMGWNSWDCFGPSVTESEVKANADYMAANLKQYGWEYIVVDIRWYVDNQTTGYYNAFDNSDFIYDEYGRYLPSPKRFPSSVNGAGFKPLADYVHSLGLKFGIHIMRGVPVVAVNEDLPIKSSSKIARDIFTSASQCPWLPDNYTIKNVDGAQAYYNSIIQLYASWGVDFIKVDDLSRPYYSTEIEMIRSAIDETRRPIVLSMSLGATPLTSGNHAKEHANMWRTVDDFWDIWSELENQFDVCNNWAPYRSPGNWPDADMLPLGHISIRGERGADRYTNFTADEQLTLMTLWTIFKSPLMFGGHLPDNDELTNSLLTYDEVLAMHGTSVNNRQLYSVGDSIAWMADDPNTSDKFLAIFNTGSGKSVASSGLISRTVQREGVQIIADITGSPKLYLTVTTAGDNFNYDHGDWINPAIYNDRGDSLLLTELTWVSAVSGWASVQKNKSLDGNPLRVNGVTYANGFGVNSYSLIEFNLPSGYTTFKALCGFDDEVLNAPNGVTIEFVVSVAGDKEVTVDLAELGFSGDCSIRDMRQKTDVGTYSGTEFKTTVPSHGARLFKISEQTTGIDETEQSELIKDFKLHQNYPNPFNPETVIRYQLSVPGYVSLTVHNTMGQKVAKLVSEKQGAGVHTAEWNAENLASGVYYYSLKTASGFKQNHKMLLLR
ncbi:NPCBM/NEW2 domain-containing protein [candidate division KSB1 bacterium]|nr:NPCBM/NEW2 domain-containing protein [candidate division KSB1 bacterium]